MTSAHDIWLVRHTPTAWTGRRWCGRADPPLSRDGRVLARDLASRLAPDLPATAIVRSSPARRARATASAIGAAAGISVAVAAELHEVDMGRVEGLTWPEVAAREPDVAAAIGRGDPIDWPDGESTAEVRERARRAASRIRTDAATRPVVVVSHGAFLHALLRVLADAPDSVDEAPLRPGGVVRLAPRDTLWVVA